jgi:hypothetical protein
MNDSTWPLRSALMRRVCAGWSASRLRGLTVKIGMPYPLFNVGLRNNHVFNHNRGSKKTALGGFVLLCANLALSLLFKSYELTSLLPICWRVIRIADLRAQKSSITSCR